MSLQTLWITDERDVAPAFQLEGLCASIGDLPCAHSLRELIITTGRILAKWRAHGLPPAADRTFARP